MMTTNAAGDCVVDLQSHPVWRAARRNSRELAAAMRRHPASYHADRRAGADPDGTGLGPRHLVSVK